MSDVQPFRLGLVMAGAVSAGAYTAGVIDFLIEALDAWEAAKQRCRDRDQPLRDWPVPPHDLRIEVMSGTSAGAMTTALAAVAFGRDLAPVRDLPPRGAATGNPLYDSWVRDVDIRKLLTTRDLQRQPDQVQALLDGTALREIADGALSYAWRGRSRPYVAGHLPIHLFVTNLRGMPYRVSFAGTTDHEMANHADRVSFLLTQPDAGEPPARLREMGLDRQAWPLPAERPQQAGWPHLADAALASGAFPLGLPARVITSRRAFYDARRWTKPETCKGAAPDGNCIKLDSEEVAPLWKGVDEAGGPDFIKFANSDGGVLNNEPFEIVRQALAGGPGKRNPREADKADAAVIMIDSFPDPVQFAREDWDGGDRDSGEDPPTDLLSVLGALVNAAKQEGRFKPEAVTLESPTSSRFMIAPAGAPRDDRDETLTSGGCAAFAGFLSEDFRRHDFMLGRRNCQRFLQRHLVLPRHNTKVFDPDWVATGADSWAVEGNREQLPLIPLMRDVPAPDGGGATYDLNDEVVLPPRPQLGEAELLELRRHLEVRLQKVGDGLARQLSPGSVVKAFMLRRVFDFGLRAAAMEKIEGWLRRGLADTRVLDPSVPPPDDS